VRERGIHDKATSIVVGRRGLDHRPDRRGVVERDLASIDAAKDAGIR
jgi:hypothetical protein